MEKTKGLVSIITVNYNGFKDTCELIESLILYEPYPYEVIVVDNASFNNEAEELRRRYSNVLIISSDINLGFAGGNNLGYLSVKGEYVLFLNNDIIITEPFLEKLVGRLVVENVGLVSPKIKYEKNRERIQFAGFTNLSPITLRNRIIGAGELDRGQFDIATKTPYVHGAAMIGKKEIIDRIGLMSEVYFLFYEELDWSIRFIKSGYELWYEPSAVVFHKECMTAKRGSSLRLYYMTRARLLFARRNTEQVRRVLACIYLTTIPLLKNTLCSIFYGKWSYLIALWKGTKDGLFDHVNDE